MRVSHFSHIGHREENQDRCAVFWSDDGSACLMLVADGLGGHSGGALAAETVVESARACWEGRDQDEPAGALLRRLAIECHKAVRKAGRDSGLDPHSTLAALLLERGRATSVHVGDSRIIQFSRSGFVERTLDHSAAQLLVLDGSITEEEMATHPDQNIVFLQLGGHHAPEPNVTEWDLSKGDRFVLCSDGFWELFPAEEMSDLLVEKQPADEAQRRIDERLRHLTEHDNITAIFAECETGDRPMSLLSTWARRLAGAKSLALVSFAFVLFTAFQLGGGTGFVAFGQESENPETPAGEAVEGGEAGGDGVGTEAGEGAPTDAPGGDTPSEEQSGDGAPPDSDTQSDAEATDGAATEDAAAREGKPVPLDPVSIEAGIPVEAGETPVDTAEAEMRRRGDIGANDRLVPKGDPREVGDSVFTRAEQTHQGVPVYVAEVVIRTIGDRIVSIDGDSAGDIQLPAGLPENDYPATLTLAGVLLDEEITPWNDGTRVIFALTTGYRRAWLGEVTIGVGVAEEVVFDAADGAVLFRVPVVLDARAVRRVVGSEQ